MIQVFRDLELLSQAGAELFVDLASQAIAVQGRFSTALAGGQTPRRLYEILSTSPLRDRVRWADVHIFWGDERCVSTDDPRSNALMAHHALLDQVPLPAKNIHPVQTNLPPAQAAQQYEKELRDFFGNQPPTFDLVLLGLGDNAHTASLFPHTAVLDEHERWAADVFVVAQNMYRVTLTPPIINQARQVVFLVSGADKALAVQNVLEGEYKPHEFPAQLIRPIHEHPAWLLDKAASHKLTMPVEEDGGD